MTTGAQTLPPEALRRIQWAMVSCIVMPVLGAIYLVYAELWPATWVMALQADWTDGRYYRGSTVLGTAVILIGLQLPVWLAAAGARLGWRRIRGGDAAGQGRSNLLFAAVCVAALGAVAWVVIHQNRPSIAEAQSGRAAERPERSPGR